MQEKTTQAMIPLMHKKLSNLLSKLPNQLSEAIETEYQALIKAYYSRKWDDVQTAAGRFAEAVLRVLEFHTSGSYTPIDGVHKPNRKTVIGNARNDTSLSPSLRLQIPSMTELIMDFRNNRNAVHLGNIKPWHLDGMVVAQMTSWIVAELVRLESKVADDEVQGIINSLAELPSPLIQRVADIPIVLDASLRAEDKALILLLDSGGSVDAKTLCSWSEYGNSSRWVKQILKKLVREKKVYIDKDNQVHLLRPGEALAQQILSKSI